MEIKVKPHVSDSVIGVGMMDCEPSSLKGEASSKHCVVSGLGWLRAAAGAGLGAGRLGCHPRSSMSFAVCPSGSLSLSPGLKFLNGEMKHLE